MRSVTLVIAVSLLLTVWTCYFCAGQTGECPVVTSSLRSVTTYTRISEIYYTTCNWISTCSRTRYRQVGNPTFVTVYSSTFACCNGYQLVGGNTCSPVCSQTCQNGGVCSSPGTCNCTSQWTGNSCQTSVCTNVCMNGGTCSAPDTCSCPPQWTGNTCQTDVNECTSRTNNCQQTCINTPGAFMCDCNRGYTLDSNGNTCTDINECSTSDHDCEQLCMNTDGSYQCACEPGYMLRNNQQRCSDINECSTGTHNCEHTCTNTDGSFTCSCSTGYILQSDGFSCADIDECTRGTHNCQQECTNTPGSFRCGCRTGYVPSNETAITCTDINECADNTHNCQQICVNTQGSFTCACNGGLVLGSDGRSCYAGPPPNVAPTVQAIQRTSDTRATVSWSPLSVTGRDNDIIAYNVKYREALRDSSMVTSCSSLTPDRNDVSSMVVEGDEVELVINELNPGEEYCLWIAGVSMNGVGVYGSARRVPLFTNTPFQVLLITNEICSTWLSNNQEVKLNDVTSSVTTLMAQMCSCSLTTNHIVDEKLLCNQGQSDSNEVVFQGRMVSLPTTSSQDMVQLLRTYANNKEASLMIQGEAVIIEPCLIDGTQSSDANQCRSPHTVTTTTPVVMVTDTTLEKAFPLIPVIAGAAGGGLLVIALILVLLGCGCGFCLARKGKGSENEYKSRDLPVAPSIEMSYRPKKTEAELYADISDDVKPTQTGSLATRAGQTYTSIGPMDEGNPYTRTKMDQQGGYTTMGQLDEGNAYTRTKMDQQDMYIYMASLEKTTTPADQQYYEELGETDATENIYSLPRGVSALDYEEPMMSRNRQQLTKHTDNNDNVESGYY